MNRKLAGKIQQMVKADQKARWSFVKNASFVEKVQEIDRVNVAKMKKIVKDFGWPTIQLVGKKTSNLAWLLVQHADHDLKFQSYCLRLMIKEAKRGNVLWENVAYLTDRILVNKGKPQLYGTQFYESKGKLVPRPIKDADKLNERREKMNLEPLEVYKKRVLKYKRRIHE